MSAAIVRLMQDLRSYPLARLEHPSLARINCYIGGYVSARIGSEVTGENDLLLDFDEWLRLAFGTGWHGNAESILTLNADDDAHAVRMYFDLFENFMAWRSTPEASSVMPLRGRLSGSDERLPRQTLDEILRRAPQVTCDVRRSALSKPRDGVCERIRRGAARDRTERWTRNDR